MLRHARRRHGAADSSSLMGWVENPLVMTFLLSIVSAVAMAFMNPPPREGVQLMQATEPTPFYLELRWGERLPHDIDISVACYNSANGLRSNPVFVYFAHRSEKWLTLVHDATGYPRSTRNVEEVRVNSDVVTVPQHTTCRVNTHLYSRHGGVLPIEATLLAIANKDSPDQKVIALFKFPVASVGEECSVLEVTWDAEGKYVPDAVKTYPHLQTARLVPVADKNAPTCTPIEGGPS